MEYASIEREIHVDASPEVVFEVISRPEHLREWWPDDAELEPVPGAVGKLVWRGDDRAEPMNVPLTVLKAEPPRIFSFRWTHPADEKAEIGNSLLVTFELAPAAGGTTVRMTETGFREMGWEAAVLEAAYQEHGQGWDHFIPRLGEYVARLVSAS
jgi:uncharacterized protein YndB with AHSA1/START domain